MKNKHSTRFLILKTRQQFIADNFVMTICLRISIACRKEPQKLPYVFLAHLASVEEKLTIESEIP